MFFPLGKFYEHFSKIKWLVYYLTNVSYFLIIFQYTYTEKRYGTKKRTSPVVEQAEEQAGKREDKENQAH